MLKLRHEHLIPAFDLFEIYNKDNMEQSLAIVTPYYINGDLNKQIISQREKNEPLPEEIVFEITKNILKALNYLHSDVGVAHRDLKPANIFLRKINFQKKTVEVVIGDLGIAREMNGTNTTCGTIAGTPLFCAPEVTLGKYNLKCDIYSAGVVLYQMLSLDTDTNLIASVFSKHPLTKLQEASCGDIIKEFTENSISKNYPKETKILKKLKGKQTFTSIGLYLLKKWCI